EHHHARGDDAVGGGLGEGRDPQQRGAEEQHPAADDDLVADPDGQPGPGWAWIVAILGFAAALTGRHRPPGTGQPRHTKAHEPRWRRGASYANQAVLPFYLLHEPVIVAAAWVIVRWHAPTAVKYPALVVVSFAATLAIYEFAVRRYRPTRLLFGMKARQPSVRE